MNLRHFRKFESFTVNSLQVDFKYKFMTTAHEQTDFLFDVYCTRSVMFVGTSIYIYVFPKTFWIKYQGDIQMRD